MNRTARIALTATATTALIALTGMGAASAHVTVNPNTATAGGYAKLSFRVPTESDTATTTELQVFFPTDHPLASVSVQPHAGWSYTVKDAKLATPLTDDDGNQISQAVSEIDWKADSPASAIKPGEFDEFNISAGPLPDGGTMSFKALQTYSDGSVVRWIDPTVAGQDEPAHPAPVLTLTPAATASSSPSASMSASATATPSGTAGTPAAAKPAKESKTPLVLSIIALVVAVAGAGAGFLRRRA